MLLAFFGHLLSQLLGWVEPLYLHWTQLPQSSLALGFALDLSISKSELRLENAMLRQQLLILERQVKKPRFTRTERPSLLPLASGLQSWKSALLILKPATLLRWYREGFKLFWRVKSRARRGRPRLSPDLVTLIRLMASENPLWATEHIRGELLTFGPPVANDTIHTYLRSLRRPLSPSQDWKTFVKNHTNDVWACDFLPLIDLFFRQEVFLHRRAGFGARRSFRGDAFPDGRMGRSTVTRGDTGRPISAFLDSGPRREVW